MNAQTRMVNGDVIVTRSKGRSPYKPATWFVTVLVIILLSVILTMGATWFITISFLQPHRHATPFSSYAESGSKVVRVYGSSFDTLSDSCWPTAYDIRLKIYLSPILDRKDKVFTFKGSVAIVVECEINVDHVTINQHNLDVNHVSVNRWPTIFIVDNHKEILDVQLPRPLRKFTVTIQYSGVLRNGSRPDTSGLYYYPSEGVSPSAQLYSLGTQFQAIEARTAFPCFDEPRFRAVHNLTLTYRPYLTAVANMQLKNERRVNNSDGEWIISSYFPTPQMPSYLMAWALSGQINYVNEVYSSPLIDGRDIEIGVYGIEDQEYLNKVVNRTIRCLRFFESYLQIPYELPKLDSIISMNYRFGGMENWGLVTYRSQSVHTSNTIVGHEIAHQWFGNLVTCDSWTEMWLNEGFTSHLQMIQGADGKPSGFLDRVVSEKRVFVLHFEMLYKLSGLRTRPMFRDVDLSKPFVANNYYKAPQVLHMLYTALGAEVYQKLVTNYINDYKGTSVQLKDVILSFERTLKSLGLANRIRIEDFLESWSSNPGYLLVTRNALGRVTQIDSVVHGQIERNSTLNFPIELGPECPSTTVFYGIEHCTDLNNYHTKLSRLCAAGEKTDNTSYEVYRHMQDLLLLADLGRVTHSFVLVQIHECFGQSERPNHYRLWSVVLQLTYRLVRTPLYSHWIKHLHSIADIYVKDRNFDWLTLNEDHTWKLRRGLMDANYPGVIEVIQDGLSSIRNGTGRLDDYPFQLACLMVRSMRSGELTDLMNQPMSPILVGCSRYSWHIQSMQPKDWATTVSRNQDAFLVIIERVIERGLAPSPTNSRYLRSTLEQSSVKVVGEVWMKRMSLMIETLRVKGWSETSLALLNISTQPIESNTRWWHTNRAALRRWLCDASTMSCGLSDEELQ